MPATVNDSVPPQLLSNSNSTSTAPQPVGRLMYQKSDVAPFNVHVQRMQTSENDNVSLHPVVFGKFLRKNNVSQIVNGSLKRIGRNRVTISFSDFQAANNFLTNPALSASNYKTFIPTFSVTRLGIVRGVPSEWSEEEILENISVPIGCGPILKVRRLKRKVIESGVNELKPTESVVLTFDGQVLPKRIFMCYAALPVDLYIYPTIQCYNCCRFGHVREHSDEATCAAALAKIMVETADNVFPVKKVGGNNIPSPPWWDSECTTAAKGRKEAELAYRESSTNENFDIVLDAIDKAKKLFKKKKFEGWRNFCLSVSPNTNPSVVWNNIKRFRSAFKEDCSSNLPSSLTDEFLDKLAPPTVPEFIPLSPVLDLSGLNGPFTLLELKGAISKTKDSAPGPDEVKVLQYADDLLVYSSHRNAEMASAYLNKSLIHLKSWLDDNGLEISYSKSVVVPFARTRQMEEEWVDEASGEEAEGDDEARVLQPRLLALVRAASGEPEGRAGVWMEHSYARAKSGAGAVRVLLARSTSPGPTELDVVTPPPNPIRVPGDEPPPEIAESDEDETQPDWEARVLALAPTPVYHRLARTAIDALLDFRLARLAGGPNVSASVHRDDARNAARLLRSALAPLWAASGPHGGPVSWLVTTVSAHAGKALGALWREMLCELRGAVPRLAARLVPAPPPPPPDPLDRIGPAVSGSGPGPWLVWVVVGAEEARWPRRLRALLHTHVVRADGGAPAAPEAWCAAGAAAARQALLDVIAEAGASESQKHRENLFTKELDNLFDISHAEAMNQIKFKDDKDFLNDQGGERKMIITSLDKKLKNKIERVEKRKRRAELLRQKVAESLASTSAVPSQELNASFSSSSTDSHKEQDSEEVRFKLSVSVGKKPVEDLSSSSGIFTTHVTSALDRNKISDREAMRLMIPLAAALGQDPASLPISRSTIRRARKKARIEFNAYIRESFEPNYPLVVHWDGKILPDVLESKKVDRLPVLVSGNNSEKLLGVPKLTAGTGENTANAVLRLLEEWNVKDQVQAMSFDTTSANTGVRKGACALLEAGIGRNLLWLACRHHILEIILAKIFTLCFGPSSSPEIPLFKRFREVWKNYSRENYKGLDIDPVIEAFSQSTLEVLAKAVGREKEIRDDYFELIELATIVLNKAPDKIHWRSPGPIHHARWMAKLLYTYKIFLFRDQNVLKLTKRETNAVSRFVKFGALVYTAAWVEAPLAAEAAGNDLQMWKNLVAYEAVDLDIAKAARTVLERHLWYLSDELVGLALFSEKVTPIEKAAIVEGMKIDFSSRLVKGNAATLRSQASLGPFASKRTSQALSLLGIKDSFLKLPVEVWHDNFEYIQGKKRVKNLRVVNDTAERGVKLFEEYNKLLTKNEEEKQIILHVVEHNRKIVSTETTKTSLSPELIFATPERAIVICDTRSRPVIVGGAGAGAALASALLAGSAGVGAGTVRALVLLAPPLLTAEGEATHLHRSELDLPLLVVVGSAGAACARGAALELLGGSGGAARRVLEVRARATRCGCRQGCGDGSACRRLRSTLPWR
ncbi:hypothetical protein MSG28_005828 [Choristoneura fumiferana]|uniref:Uncharacterized protein n=1 Tax=Choristoneura fumiferana TaxID=7141 RepID=A0ACC0L0K4_CHOFU|nr:hypothetical protein MSG28_005828 [Choristoneura fumiferana]